MLKLRKIKITKSHLPTLRSVTVYASVFTVFLSAISISHHLPGGDNISSLLSTDVSAAQHESSVDEATAMQVAGSIAIGANLPIAANITNRTTSLFVESMVSRNTAAILAKPHSNKPTADERAIKSHVVKDGETTQSIATQYGVSEQTIKWANGLSSDSLDVNATISIPPVDGILYTVKDGDTIELIAEKYRSDAKRITAFNDLELSGIKHDQRIILPDGELPIEERPEYAMSLPDAVTITPTPIATSRYIAPSTSSSSTLVNGYSPISMVAAGNAYAFGNCTSWAYERRAQLGHPVGSYWGNGATWDTSARAAGYVVDKNPTVGSVFQMPAFVDAYTGAYGHVGIVESVNADGSIYISEMNYAGNFNVVTYRTIPAAAVALYNYIH